MNSTAGTPRKPSPPAARTSAKPTTQRKPPSPRASESNGPPGHTVSAYASSHGPPSRHGPPSISVSAARAAPPPPPGGGDSDYITFALNFECFLGQLLAVAVTGTPLNASLTGNGPLPIGNMGVPRANLTGNPNITVSTGSLQPHNSSFLSELGEQRKIVTCGACRTLSLSSARFPSRISRCCASSWEKLPLPAQWST